MNRRKLTVAVLCSALILSAVLSGCGKFESNPKEAETTPAVLSSAVSETTAPATKAEKTEATTKTSAEPETQPQDEDADIPNFDYNYDFEVEEDDVSDEPCTLNIDGKTYTAYIGDVVNYVFYLKTPEALEDFQAVTNYDSGMLELVETDTSEMFPIAGEFVVCNTDMPNIIKYNAVNINGMDFTSGGNMVSFKFRVLDSGGTAVSTTLEYMDSVLEEPYVSDYKIVGDIEYSEEIK